jgi:EAL domain-containing protein (putative c-di-GMP-specific phosphodiesterase class I)
VAAAALAAAQVAARAAVAVEADAAIRALDVAAAAARASEAAAADASAVAHPEESGRIAAVVAAKVAAEVVVQTRLTDDAAARVAAAVALAADRAAAAAVTAASAVEAAAGAAETSTHDVMAFIEATQTASGITVDSTERTAELALSRVDRLPQAPMVAELERAVEAEELRLHYQPMYSLGTGAIVGVEALLRWQHPTRGLLHPADFLAVAEGPHLVTPIGDWVLHAAAAQASAWQRDVGEQAPVTWVNISCDQLGRHHLTGVVERLLTESGLAPGLLGIEVTERQLARRVDDVADDLLELRELGVSLAVDDFGTGYASLDYLRRFTFDEIKIDRSFVSGLQDRTDSAVTSSIIALARALDLTVVGEGVETQAQFDRLRLLGCDVAQGYLLQRPAVAELVSEALRGPSAAARLAGPT